MIFHSPFKDDKEAASFVEPQDDRNNNDMLYDKIDHTVPNCHHHDRNSDYKYPRDRKKDHLTFLLLYLQIFYQCRLLDTHLVIMHSE